MPRKQREEMAFGADSFLDVVANVVGILIILIVVVGTKVARAPVSPPLLAIAPVMELETAPPPRALDPLPPLEDEEPDEPEVEIAFPDLSPLPVVKLPEELAAREAELLREQAALEESLRALSAEARHVTETKERAARAAESQRKALGEAAERLRGQRERLAELQSQADLLQRELAGIRRQTAAAEADGPRTEILTHRLPPIGRVVTGQEIHFLLRGNRVSVVPLSFLVERVHRDVDRRKETLLRRPFYQGLVGPIDGYEMEYMLQRQSLSVLDEIQQGRGVIRIGVTGWVIRPTGDALTETAAQALRPDSNFQQALRREGPSATVTFWVYPDSFEIHQQLKSYAHDAGYWVASRPLPEGVPIAGSPQGSKSMAQ